MTLKDALYGLFRHYVSKPVSSATSNIDAPSLDALAFSKVDFHDHIDFSLRTFDFNFSMCDSFVRMLLILIL